MNQLLPATIGNGLNTIEVRVNGEVYASGILSKAQVLGESSSPIVTTMFVVPSGKQASTGRLEVVFDAPVKIGIPLDDVEYGPMPAPKPEPPREPGNGEWKCETCGDILKLGETCWGCYESWYDPDETSA